MTEYHKISSLFVRNPENDFKTFIEGSWAKPEFEYLQNATWVFTEKIDGTNIRVLWDGKTVRFGGKTDNAQMPTRLLAALQDMFTVEKLAEHFPEKPDSATVCLYGEGFGAGIQKGGGNYSKENSFVLFDVLITGATKRIWLARENVADIAMKLGCQVAPVIGTGTLHDAIAFAKEGFQSKWGDFPAEGLVARPAIELVNRFGERIITKLKLSDFPRE